MVEIYEGVGGPQLLAKLVACDYFSGTLQQQGEHLEGLFLQAQLRAILAQFACCEVELEQAEARDSAGFIILECAHEDTTDDA
jgi:hypothetical protein